MAEIFVEKFPGLPVEDGGEFLLGEEGLLVKIVGSEHFEYSGEIVVVLWLDRYNFPLIHPNNNKYTGGQIAIEVLWNKIIFNQKYMYS